MYVNNKQNGGYIALTSAIIITVVLLVFVISIASSGYYGRFTILDSESKESSRALAEACVQTALLEYEIDDSFAGGVVIPLGSKECTIVSVSGPAIAVQIEVHAEASGAVTNLRVELDSTSDYSIVSWEEVAEF